jgi:transglutaminase-like putative cysteine protease
LARALTAFALAAALATVSWFRLEQRDVPRGAVLAVIGIALLPTLAVALGRRRAVVAGVLVLATIFAAGVAWDVSPLEARPGSSHDFFGPVLGAARDGLQDFYDATLPFDRVDYPTMHGLVVIAVFGFAALVGMLAAAKRPVAAGLALLVGVGWPATLLPGDDPLFAGALALAGMLFILFLFRARAGALRGLAPALVVGGLLVLAAVGASSTEAVAKGAFLRWQQWDLYDRPDKAVSVSYAWTSNYSGLRFPKKKTVVMRVQVDGPRRPLYWRATVLDEYNGGNWNETRDLSEPNASREQIEVVDDPLLPGAGKRRANWVQQEITIQALRDNHLIASAQPVRWRPGTSSNFQMGPSGIVTLEESLRQGQQYTAWSYAPKVGPSQLGDAGTAYPDELDPRYFEPLSGIQVPKFGVEGREQFMNALFATTNDSFLQAHRGLYQTAASLTRESPTPYAAAAVLEAWFRDADGGGFTYDETPPQLPFGEPPLVAFLKDKRGYCQHYAGAMALMLRFVGVPARVAAGFTSGRWDPDQHEWTVTDHNAHTWVEVYFPGRGWLAFDPTPGRGNLDAEYSTTAASFNGPDGAIAGLPGAFAAALGLQYYQNLTADNSGGTIRNRRNEARAIEQGSRGGDPNATSDESGDGGAGALLRLVGLLAGGGALLLVAAKTARRQLRFASKDSRRIASACRSDLVGYLADQGVDAPPSLTLSELGELVETEFAVNSDPYVHSLSEARFGPPAESGPAIRRARRELRLLRRELGRQLSVGRRLRGTLSARSLTS